MPQDKDRKYAACRDPNYSGLHPYTMGGFIHVLLVVAIAVALIQIISGRRAI
jgi:hypothetical protein